MANEIIDILIKITLMIPKSGFNLNSGQFQLKYMGKSNDYTKNIAISETKTFAILLVIFYHCMHFYKEPTPFWPLNAGIASPGVITVMAFLKGCLVPSLVLCSGFLFLLSTKNHPRSRWEMLKNKVKRLIWPYFIYGALWLVPL